MPEPDSPIIQHLKADLESGAPDVLEHFWSEMAQRGTPLFEPLPADHPQYASHERLTFVWRGEHDHVLVVSPLGDLREPETLLLARLPDSDVWYRTYTPLKGLRSTYYFMPDMPLRFPQPEELAEFMRQIRPDPLNVQTFVTDDPEHPILPQRFVQSVLASPSAPPQPYLVPASSCGQVTMTRFKSELLGDERRVYVYTPPGYRRDNASYPLVLIFDGHIHATACAVPTTLDNLIAAGQIPPVVAVLLDNPNRSVELPCSEPFVDFLTGELLPWARLQYSLTDDPAQTVVAGSSYGGLAAAWAAFKRPDVFGKVLSQAGSFWWRPGANWNKDDMDGEFGWLVTQYRDRERLPIQFYQEVGKYENEWIGVGMNRHMRDVLLAKGYPLTYHEFVGGHDYSCWRGTLADGLIVLLGQGAQR